MNNVIEKTKNLLTGKTTPITKDEAKMITITGSRCSIEQRMKIFIDEINSSIETKARSNQFQYLVVLPQDLISKKKTIQEEFSQRGFDIYTIKQRNNKLFIISWE